MTQVEFIGLKQLLNGQFLFVGGVKEGWVVGVDAGGQLLLGKVLEDGQAVGAPGFGGAGRGRGFLCMQQALFYERLGVFEF
jgi:hypothetical protein